MGVSKYTKTYYEARCTYCSKPFMGLYSEEIVEFDSIEDLKDEIEAFEWDFINEDHICCPKCCNEQIEEQISESRYE